MTRTTIPLPRAARIGLLIAMGLVLAGCQSPLSFPTPDTHWRTETGQLQYMTPQRSVIGDCVVSMLHGDEFQLDFVAGPGVPLMKLRESGGVGRAEGIFARGSWQGDIANAPEHLRSWFALREIVTGVLNGTSRAGVDLERPGTWSGAVQVLSSGPNSIKIQFLRSDMPRKSAWMERFVFHFNR